MDDFSRMLLVSDYDRTMTAFDGTIPPANQAAVARFLAGGGAFTIATGRSRPMFRQPAAELPLDVPVIVANGAAVWEPARDRITVYHALGSEDLARIRELHGRWPGLRLELQGLRGHRCFGRDPLRDAYMARYGMTPDYGGWEGLTDTYLVACFYAPFRSPFHSRPGETCPEDEAPFDEMERLLAGSPLDTVRSLPRMIELLPRGCGKGAAARRLAGTLGREVLLCAGDAPNDLPMLEEADRAFVPASADEAVLHRGYEVVADCDRGAVADLIARLERTERST